ncbi:MAG TPA: hypothetical protein VIQ05_16050 [Tardiphaga sp.]
MQPDRLVNHAPSPNLQWALEKVRTNSAVNPLLWLAALVLPTTLTGAYFLSDYRSLFVAIFLFVIAAPVGAYFYWMIKDPNRLQSEDYQLEKQRMLLGDDRHPGAIIEGSATVPVSRVPHVGGPR